MPSLSDERGRGQPHTSHAHAPRCLPRGAGPIGRVRDAVDTCTLPSAPGCRDVQSTESSSPGGAPRPTSVATLPELSERAVCQPAPNLELTAWRGSMR